MKPVRDRIEVGGEREQRGCAAGSVSPLAASLRGLSRLANAGLLRL